jgi:hypothetical protein
MFGEHGAFNELYDKADGRALSDHLQTTSSKYYGVAGFNASPAFQPVMP